MRPANRPRNEAARLEVLRRYDLLDSLPEQSFDDIAQLAAYICETPIAHISLVDEHRQWFKSEIGTTLRETPRDISFCSYTILEDGLLIVPDTNADARFSDSPLVTGDNDIRFYAGAPLLTPEGVALGALCVLDHVPRQLTQRQQDALGVLSRQVMAQMELRRQTRELIATEAAASLAAAMSAHVEREFRALFAANPLPMWIYDKSSLQFLEVNDAAVVRYGFTRDEFLAMTIKDIRPLEDVDRLLRSIAGGRPAFLEAGNWRHRLKSGRIINVDITSHELQFAGMPAVLVVAQDITERRRAEDALRASEDRYRKLFEAAPDGLVIADQLSTYIDGNASICRMLGYERHEFVGLNAKDILVPTDVQHIEPALQKLKAEKDFHHDLQFRRKDGSVFSAEVSATPLPDGTFLGIIRDVTERNEAVTALRLAEERTRHALRNANVGIWDINHLTGQQEISETMEIQFGFAPGTYPGTTEAFMSRIHPDDRAAVNEATKVALTSGTDYSVTHRVVHPDGKVRWITAMGRIELDSEGKPLRGTGISIDVTERRNLEEQYQQAQKMEAIGRLAGGVAHDFNNLLTAILGYCELLLVDLPAQDTHRPDLLEIQKAGTRAAGLTRQLLAFSRREIIAPTLIDLNDVVLDMKSMLQRLIGEDITVQIELGQHLSQLKADRGQLEQIVMNLAVNARDAMPQGGVLTLKTASTQLDADFHDSHSRTLTDTYVSLTVSDTGVGMSADVQARAFEPFFTTKEVGKGTGLGLATVHGIMKQAGGTVRVRSELGQGTSITVYFPVATDSGGALPEIHPHARPHAGVETVLVVEDEDGLRELIRRLLLRQGYVVHVAANADEAEIMFASIKADVLLTDVVMPGGSGPDLTRRLLATHPGLRVVYMSGYTEDAIVHHGVLEPDIAFVHKPFTAESLSQKLREVLDR